MVSPPWRSSVMRARRNSPSAVSRRWLSLIALRLNGSPLLTCSSCSIVLVAVRTLPTMRTWSTKTWGPSWISNVTATCVSLSLSAVLAPTVALS